MIISNQFKYKNHKNEVMEFGTGAYVTGTELHDYSWGYTTENNQISNLNRGVVQRKMVVTIACKDRTEAIDLINKLVEITEKDVLAQKKGRLYWNNYYLNCYVTESKKVNYDARKSIVTAELTIISDYPAWITEYNKSFTNGGSEGKNLDYPFDFPYDFASPTNSTELENYSFIDSDFKLSIYGEVTNPAVVINGHYYEVEGHVAEGQYLEIDSKNKTIMLVENNGNKVNWFKNRNKESYIFEKIPAGVNPVTWAGNFMFEIVIYEERSEPKWT